MDRLSIDITPDEKQQIKALAARNGQSIKDYVLERVLPDADETAKIGALLMQSLAEDRYSDWTPEKAGEMKARLRD